MFTQNVNLIKEIPAETINKICKTSLVLDKSFEMTMLMLLYNRVENLKIRISTSIEATDISSDPDEYSFYFIIDQNPDNYLSEVKNKFKSIEKLPTHDKFLSEKLGHPIHIRLMPDENTACVFLSNFEAMKTWHCVQFFIPKYYKIFKEKPITKEETSFLESLTFRMDSNYIAKLSELANKESFQKFIMKDQIAAFEKKLFNKKVAAAKLSLSTIEQDMENLLQAYKNACEKRINAMALVCGLESMTADMEDHTELQDYIMNNKRICNVRLDGSRISFIAKTFYAPRPNHVDEYETMSKNITYFSKYASAVCASHPIWSKENVKILMDSIFSSKRCFKLRLCAYFTMDYFGTEITSSKGYDYAAVNKSLKDYIPNPHIDNYNCFSENKAAILEHLKLGDALGAIESAIACTQRINIHESMNFDPFIKKLLGFKDRCLVLEDGTEMTPAEALEYLKEKANGN